MRYGVLEREQLLGTSLEQAWNHFSDPRNLASITPAQLGLRIHDPERLHPLQEGRIIHYTVSPLWGVPLRWTTRIGRVHPPILFEDFQLKGPAQERHCQNDGKSNDHRPPARAPDEHKRVVEGHR